MIAAQALITHGLPDPTVAAYVARTWHLSSPDANAAVTAAHILTDHHVGPVAISRTRPNVSRVRVASERTWHTDADPGDG